MGIVQPPGPAPLLRRILESLSRSPMGGQRCLHCIPRCLGTLPGLTTSPWLTALPPLAREQPPLLPPLVRMNCCRLPSPPSPDLSRGRVRVWPRRTCCAPIRPQYTQVGLVQPPWEHHQLSLPPMSNAQVTVLLDWAMQTLL